MALNMQGPGAPSQDPRGPMGQLARGANVYMGASNSPYAGKMTNNAVDKMKTASLLPEYKKASLADVARQFLNGAQ